MQYAIISDVHANWTALQAVDQYLQTHYPAPPPAYWFLGDLVGYGPAQQGLACVRWLRQESGIQTRWVAGNHDEWIVRPQGSISPRAMLSLLLQRSAFTASDCLEDWGWFREYVLQNIRTDESISGQNPLLGSEPESLKLAHFDSRGVPLDQSSATSAMSLAFVHGAVLDSVRRTTYLHLWREKRMIMEMDLKRLSTALNSETICLFHGHTHFPVFVEYREGGLRLHPIVYDQPLPMVSGIFAVNPGSVGQPRDGDPRASFVVIDTATKTVTFHRVSYANQRVTRQLTRESQKRKPLAALHHLAEYLQHQNGTEYALYQAQLSQVIDCWEKQNCPHKEDERGQRKPQYTRDDLFGVHIWLQTMIKTAIGHQELHKYESEVYVWKNKGLVPMEEKRSDV